MEKFLETVAKYIFSKHKSGFEDICMVFPNRRAGVFFNAYLQKLVDRPVIAPEVVTVNDFISRLSDRQPAGKLKLIALLYQVFLEHTKTPESFDDFYFWGEVLLSDFNDIDLYLADPSLLFQNLVDLKEIESQFDYLDEGQKQALRQFWGSLGRWDKYGNQEEFLKLWKLLYPVYNGFRDKLEKEEIAYNGKIYRGIAEKIKAGERLSLKAAHYYIVGLNVLNECEKVVFKYLKSEKKADFLWDYDVSYLDDPKNEAGLFIRENLVAFPPPEDFQPEVDCFNKPKQIEFVSVASASGQAQILPRVISISETHFDNTAIILADESLLFPVLGAIPESAGPVNVTMGYPVKNSAVYGFISLLSSLIRNTRVQEKQASRFYYQFIFDILNHQLLGGIESETVSLFLEQARKMNRIYISEDELGFSDLHKVIFNLPEKIQDFSPYFKEILKRLFLRFREIQSENKVVPELIATIYKAFDKIEQVFAELGNELTWIVSPTIYFRIMDQYLGQETVAFEGEPLSGLQVMGVLETRCLDFDNLVIIGFNDDFWPRTSLPPSFIPHSLRFVFGLPSIDHIEAMYAYYFYRLMQKAEKVTATFNSGKDGISTGELSRFGYQLIYDSKHEVVRKNMVFRFLSSQPKPLSSASSAGLVSELIRRYSLERPLSASALNMFMGCKYKFYLRYVVGLPEGDEITEEVDRRLFGNIFHRAAERLYRLANGRITSEWIDSVLKNKTVGRIVKEAFAIEYFKTGPEKAGQLEFDGNVGLTYELIKSYLVQLLNVDRTIAPFEVISLEKKYAIDINVKVNDKYIKVPVGGIIDRVDRFDGSVRVIDYKSGRLDDGLMSVKSIEEIFDREPKKQKKEAFQAFLYSYVLKKSFFKNDNIIPGIYALRNLYKENFSSDFSFDKQRTVFSQVEADFEIFLKELVAEIFSPETNFSQTKIEEMCKQCPYKIICHRD